MPAEVWITGIGIISCLGAFADELSQPLLYPHECSLLVRLWYNAIQPLAVVDAVRIAIARIAAGQIKLALVGGAHNGELKDLLMLYEFAGFVHKDAYRPVWLRRSGPGFALGSLGAFLILEEREHAETRGAEPIAKLSLVLSGRTGRDAGAVTEALRRMWALIEPRLEPGRYAILSGATGVEPATAEEQGFLGEHPDRA